MLEILGQGADVFINRGRYSFPYYWILYCVQEMPIYMTTVYSVTCGLSVICVNTHFHTCLWKSLRRAERCLAHWSDGRWNTLCVKIITWLYTFRLTFDMNGRTIQVPSHLVTQTDKETGSFLSFALNSWIQFSFALNVSRIPHF